MNGFDLFDIVDLTSKFGMFSLKYTIYCAPFVNVRRMHFFFNVLSSKNNRSLEQSLFDSVQNEDRFYF